MKKKSYRYNRKNIRITGGGMIVDKKARKTKRRKTKKRKTNLKNLKKSIRRKKNNSLKGGGSFPAVESRSAPKLVTAKAGGMGNVDGGNITKMTNLPLKCRVCRGGCV